jgi:hypothetical protein
MRGKQSKNDMVGRLSAVGAGLKQHFAGQTLTLATAAVKVDDILTTLDGYAAQVAATLKAHAAWTQQVDAERAQKAQVTALLQTVEDFLRGFYGPRNTLLADFGLAVRKPRKPTTPTLATAVQKSAATRVARHTMGPRQKAAIHGPAATPPAPSGTGGTNK